MAVATDLARAPGNGRRPPWARFLVALVACIAAAAVLVPTIDADPSSIGVYVALIALAAAMTWAAWGTSRTASGRTRFGWRAIAACGLVRIVTESTRLAEEAGQFETRAAEASYLLAAAVLVVALRGFFPRPTLRSERLRQLMAAAIVALSVCFVGRILIAARLQAETGNVLTSDSLQTALFILAIALASLALILLATVGRRAWLTVGLLAGGFLMDAHAAAGHALKAALGFVSEEHMATGSALAYLFYILAALAPRAAERTSAAVRRSPREAGLTGLATGIPAVAAIAWGAWTGAVPDDPLLVALGSAILLLLLARQSLLARDTAELLEAYRRVEDLEEASTELNMQVRETRRMMEAVADGVIGVDRSRRIIGANPHAGRLLGRDATALLGETIGGVLNPSEDGADPIGDVLASGWPARSGDHSFTRADGTVFPVEMAVGPAVEEGETVGAVVVFRDITERRAVERMKDEFVSVVSHELRTPLTAIRGSLGLLDSGRVEPLQERSRKLVALALDSSVRLGRLVDDLLDIERLESGGATLVFADHEVDLLVRTAIEGVSALSTQVPVTLATRPIPGLVHADGDRVVQALTNLLGNAIKYSPPGSTITVSGRRTEEAVEIAVSDQGRGIPPEKLETIFERFEQVDSSDSRDKGGTGLGLSICRTIVRRHGGRIRADSQLGHGSTFTITLPVELRTGPAPDPSRTTRPEAAAVGSI